MAAAKRKKKTLLPYVILLAAALTAGYLAYAFVYRGNTEPPVHFVATNKNASVHSLQGMISMLRRKEELVSFAFGGRMAETQYGTYIVPGMDYTRSITLEEPGIPAVCTSMTPQGLAVTEEYVLISAYCHAHKHNSVIYVIDKESHSLIKEIVLPGMPHVGGIAYDPEHQILWYSSNEQGIAQAISIQMDALRGYDYDQGHLPVVTSQVCSLYGIVRDSFMTFYEGSLYVGCFDRKNNSVIARYPVDEEGNLITELRMDLTRKMAVPEDYSTISRRAQGMAFYHDKLLLSHSWGILPSSLVIYTQSNDRLYVNEYSAKQYRLPERLEQICVDGEDLYVLFESAAYPYRMTSTMIVDRVLKLSLPKMLAFEEPGTVPRTK